MNRRKFLKATAAALFIPVVPAIICPSDAQILQFSGAAVSDPPVNSIPLTYSAAQFSSNESQAPLTLTNDQTLLNKSITASGSPSLPASVVMANNSTIKNCRIDSDECVRVGNGTYTIEDSYLEATGSGDDHADTIQAYAGGPARFIINITRCSIVAHNTAATAGLFTADDCTGDIFLTDVVFNGGPFGMKIHADAGGDTRLYLNRVYFVGPFGTAPYTFLDFAGGKVIAEQWDNVYNATIVNDELVVGSPLSPP